MIGGSTSSCLVLGGVRSGKSAFAERRALMSGLACIYLATAEAWDAEMAERIARHRARRAAGWRTIEESLAVPRVLRETAHPGTIVLVDCLTLWLTNLMMAERDVDTETRALVEALREACGPVLLVSNEVGQGIVPDNPMARRFVDLAGRLHQAVARAVPEVVLVVAGLPLRLKGGSAVSPESP